MAREKTRIPQRGTVRATCSAPAGEHNHPLKELNSMAENVFDQIKKVKADDYKVALETLWAKKKISETQRDMLRAQYRALNHTITASKLARAVGLKGYKAVNLLYGRLAHRLWERLRLPSRGLPSSQGRGRWIGVLEPNWEKGAGGQWKGTMHPSLVGALEALGWVAEVPGDVELNPDEMPEQAQLFEGAVRRVKVNAYERSRDARRQCLAHYGSWCIVCGFNFERAYGKAAKGFIHVHHIRMINEIGKEYRIDPVRDLRPVCPNCHAVIHLNPRPYTIRKVMEMLAAHRPPGWLDPPEVREARLRQPPEHFSRMTPKSR
jgi:predicted HNH restriction endonuclease